jgi:hypothetical protein
MSEEASKPNSNERRIRAYLARELDEAEAERFEEELFADDELALETQRALEIRAALRDTGAKAMPPRAARRPRLTYGLAAAAAVALMAVTVQWLQPPVEPVFRGVEQRMGLTIEADGRELRARWATVAGATGYELRILARDGELLDSVEVDATEAVVDIRARASGAAAFAEVVALDELGQTLRRSDRVAVTD